MLKNILFVMGLLTVVSASAKTGTYGLPDCDPCFVSAGSTQVVTNGLPDCDPCLVGK